MRQGKSCPFGEGTTGRGLHQSLCGRQPYPVLHRKQHPILPRVHKELRTVKNDSVSIPVQTDRLLFLAGTPQERGIFADNVNLQRRFGIPVEWLEVETSGNDGPI